MRSAPCRVLNSLSEPESGAESVTNWLTQGGREGLRVARSRGSTDMASSLTKDPSNSSPTSPGQRGVASAISIVVL